jgi:hypothetical protein
LVSVPATLISAFTTAAPVWSTAVPRKVDTVNWAGAGRKESHPNSGNNSLLIRLLFVESD